jgi:hypothetical protein
LNRSHAHKFHQGRLFEGFRRAIRQSPIRNFSIILLKIFASIWGKQMLLSRDYAALGIPT